MAIKAVGLLSGGLDSTLAARLMLEQGIEVHAVNFTSPFCTCTPKSAGCAAVVSAVRQLGVIPLKRIGLGDEYLEMVRAPRHGHGRGINPCIDCRIMKIRRAAEYMHSIGARFLFTGEVLGQRPMSQHRRALETIERESGVAGLILRPLSATLLEPTIPEREGWVDRGKLPSIKGRSRREQIGLAEEMGINDYPCPAGGCLLTDRNFSERLRDYFEHTPAPRAADIPLLKVGRHFRMPSGDKVVVARNAGEGESLTALVRDDDYLLVPQEFSGPVVLLRGCGVEEAIAKLLEYTKHEIPPAGAVQILHRKETAVRKL